MINAESVLTSAPVVAAALYESDHDPAEDDVDSGSAHQPPPLTEHQRTAAPAAAPVVSSPAPTAPSASAVAPPDNDDSGHASDSTDQTIPVRVKRKRWSQAEVEALKKGYKEFGALPNVWVLIRTKYADVLGQRSNVNLKDKFRNLLLYGHLDATTVSAEPDASAAAAEPTSNERENEAERAEDA